MGLVQRRFYLVSDSWNPTFCVSCLVLGIFLLLLVRMFRGICSIGHDERYPEHVVQPLLFVSGGQLSRAVQLPLGWNRDADEPRPQLNTSHLCTHGRMEQKPCCQYDE